MQESHGGTSAKMCVNAHISCRAAKTFAFPVRYVLFCFRISILLGHTEIDNMDDCGQVMRDVYDIPEADAHYWLPWCLGALLGNCQALCRGI